MALLKFLKGNYSSLNSKAIAEGQILICGDTGEMFVDVAADKRVKIGDFIVIDTLANLEALDASAVPTSRLYYVEDGNILARSNGTSWVQINKQPTADQIKTMIGLADYETKSDAADKLAEAKEYADGKFEAVQKEVDDLEKLVGTIPETAAATDIVGYIQEKTAGIATDAALEELTGRVKTAEDDISAIEASIGTVEEGKTVVGLIEAAQAAAEAADAKAVKAQEEVDALEVVVANYKTENDAAVEAAKKAGDDAQADVDALAAKVGEVAEGKTVVQMISDAKAAATYNDAEVRGLISDNADAIEALEGVHADDKKALEDAIALKADKSVVEGVVADYLKKADKDELSGLISDEVEAREAGDAALDARLVEVEAFFKLAEGEALYAALDTLVEIQGYITSEGAAADQMVLDIAANKAAHEANAAAIAKEVEDRAAADTALSERVEVVEGKAHTHDNKSVLDGISAEKVAAWDVAEANVQADWNVNDETSDAYIQNRPFYTYTGDKVVHDEIYAKEYFEVTDTHYLYDYENPSFNIVSGRTYTVIIDGIEYNNIVAREAYLYSILEDAGDPGYTFFIRCKENRMNPDGNGYDLSIQLTKDTFGNTDHTVKIMEQDAEVNVKIPVKYMPDEVTYSFDELYNHVYDLRSSEHSHDNKALLDTYTQTEADLADAVAKKHSHANADELDLIAEGDVAKWNAAEGNAKDHADAEIKKLAEGAVADNAAAIADNAEAIALKANAADVYAKTETYTQEEVDAAIEDALVAAMSWGEF